MRVPARAVSGVVTLLFLGSWRGHSQALSLAAATGPVFLPGSGATADWQGSLALGLRAGAPALRLEAMYTGMPGADLVAVTANVLWNFREVGGTKLEPYVLAGVGDYVKFRTERFGLNGGAGVRRWVGPLRLFGEVRYHALLHQFDEAPDTDTFVAVSVGVVLVR